MVHVDVTEGSLTVCVEGLDRIWALKSQVQVPLAHVAEVKPGIADAPWWRSIHMPGTNLPGVLRAGSFYDWGTHEWSFWDVHDPGHAVTIDLRDEHYARLVVEVANPAETVARLERARAASR